METRRFANRDRDFTKEDEYGNRVCRFCRKKIAKGVYCSKQCHVETDVRCGFLLRGYVYNRDHGICADCDIDTSELDDALHSLFWKLKPGFHHANGSELFNKILKQCGVSHWPQTTENIHHVKAVEDGGGCCGLDNLITLCARCHKRRHARRGTSKNTVVRDQPLERKEPE